LAVSIVMVGGVAFPDCPTTKQSKSRLAVGVNDAVAVGTLVVTLRRDPELSSV
jgi:hypothetical protein